MLHLCCIIAIRPVFSDYQLGGYKSAQSYKSAQRWTCLGLVP